jgi:hypothetical protein
MEIYSKPLIEPIYYTDYKYTQLCNVTFQSLELNHHIFFSCIGSWLSFAATRFNFTLSDELKEAASDEKVKLELCCKISRERVGEEVWCLHYLSSDDSSFINCFLFFCNNALSLLMNLENNPSDNAFLCRLIIWCQADAQLKQCLTSVIWGYFMLHLLSLKNPTLQILTTMIGVSLFWHLLILCFRSNWLYTVLFPIRVLVGIRNSRKIPMCSYTSLFPLLPMVHFTSIYYFVLVYAGVVFHTLKLLGTLQFLCTMAFLIPCWSVLFLLRWFPCVITSI